VAVSAGFGRWPGGAAPVVRTWPDPAALEDGSDFEEEDQAILDAQAAYRTAVVDRFGALPRLPELTAGVDELNAELLAWRSRCNPDWTGPGLAPL
jgi:hypothetical protein